MKDLLAILRAIEAAATPGPWEEARHDGRPIVITVWCNNHPAEPYDESRANLLLTQALRNLAPELLALWDACECKDHLTDAITVFNTERIREALAALNAKGKEVIHE